MTQRNRLPDSEIERLRKLCDLATPGPWRVEDNEVVMPSRSSRGDVAFIASSRAALPALLDALTETKKLLGEVVESYEDDDSCTFCDWDAADDEPHPSTCIFTRIRSALGEEKS